MHSSLQNRAEPESLALRRQAGRWLKQKREERGFSQRQLADRLSLDYYTFISQLETGRGRIPPERYADWAQALGMESRDFVFVLMRYYDPITFELLFPEEAERDSSLLLTTEE